MLTLEDRGCLTTAKVLCVHLILWEARATATNIEVAPGPVAAGHRLSPVPIEFAISRPSPLSERARSRERSNQTSVLPCSSSGRNSRRGNGQRTKTDVLLQENVRYKVACRARPSVNV